MEQPLKNPYKKGKSKLVADLMLEGWGNEKIYNHIRENKLDDRFSNPVTMNGIYKVRTKFNSTGLTDRLAQREQKAVPTIETEFQENAIKIETPKLLYDSQQQETVPEAEEKPNGRFPPVGRPEWDILTVEQINNIGDASLRTMILEYRSYREKIKQEVTPDYATSEQFEGFKAEIQENLLGLDGRLNDLKESLSETIVETLNKMQVNNPTNTEFAEIVEDDVILPSIDLETENLLEATLDEVIELEGTIIATKKVGFYAKSLLFFDLVRKKGFKGNLADFVNSSINSAMKGRKFKLVVEEDIE